jgi:hypothetical protein
MKGFKDVEATRRQYHEDGARGSVHRAALCVPEIAGTTAEISFLNHFRLKRGYEQIGCRVTAVDGQGQRAQSRLYPVRDARVHTIPLTGTAGANIASYLVEFFAAENLFIPFPAVMVNHRGAGFLNTVHAYNRVLNDVFEDDTINAQAVREASIDIDLEPGRDTFVLFAAGMVPCRGTLELDLVGEAGALHASQELDVARFGTHWVGLKNLFGEAAQGGAGILTVRQPSQPMFFGRLLAGQQAADGAISANHSYYDSSDALEYWDDARPSSRLYPFMPDLDNRIRMYPVMSPSQLDLEISLFGTDGAFLGANTADRLNSPGERFAEVSIDGLAAALGLAPAAVSGFALSASPVDGQTPTRINHQLIYGRGGLDSSINVSLFNPNVFQPEGKTGFCWGQVAIGGGLEACLGISLYTPETPETEVAAVFYDEDGEVARRHWTMPRGSSKVIDPVTELAPELGKVPSEAPLYLWYVLETEQPALSAYAVSRHGVSGHASGEHSF